MRRPRTAGIVGGLTALGATGAAAGLAAQRLAVGRARLRPDPTAGEPFFALPADRERQVVADDGVALHVEEVGPAGAPLTVVFSHGYTEQLAIWHFQRQALAGQDVRLVLWDQRAHGRSGRGSPERATIDQLGRDLSAVLEATAPRGPVVLVGHSMGGMTVMALADQRPELFGERVVGVALVSTSAGRLSEVNFGLPTALTGLVRRVLPLLTRGVRLRPGPFERGRQVSADLAFLVTRRVAFGSTDVAPSLVEFMERMTAQCPLDVIAEFYDTFTDHDRLAALDVLRGVPVLLVVGTRDRVTPPDHSRAMAEALPEAELVVVEGAGHLVHLECPEDVTHALRGLLGRARRPARPT